MSEIEIEKKFLLSDSELGYLLSGAVKGEEVTLVNTYYDSADYALTTKDWWLRKRNGAFELKISLQPDGHRTEDRYREITDEVEICRELDLPPEGELDAVLREQGIAPFLTYVTHRCSYAKNGFTIDVDDVDFGTFRHHVVEIELIVPDPVMGEEAGARILAFARQHGLSTGPVPGKATVYLQRERPEHFEALRKAGVVIE